MSITNKNYPIASEVLCLEDLLSISQKYAIPSYQRPYEWNEENIDKFLQSIMDGFRNKERGKQVFFGTMQVAQNIKDSNILDIVDGQQRLTTFILFLNTLRRENEPIYLDVIKDNPINGIFEIDTDKEYMRNYNIGKYKENMSILRKKLEVYQEEYTEDIKDSLRKYTLENIYLVKLQTSKEMPLSDVVAVFNTINTTGLDLNAADVFKFRYYDFLNSIDKETKVEWMEEINKCYELIEQSNTSHHSWDRIEMSWVLDVYKHIICAKFKFGFRELSKSNMKFFEDLFSDEKYKEMLADSVLTYDSFKSLVERFLDYYRWLETQIRNNKYVSDPMELFSYQMVSKTRYSRYWTLPFVAAFFAYEKGESNVNDEIYINCLKIMLSFFKYFTVYSVLYAKVINDVQNRVCLILQDFVNEPYYSICSKVENLMWRQWIDSDSQIDTRKEEDKWEKRNFWNYLEKDLYDNGSRTHLVCTLSALIDEVGCKTEISEIHQKLFNWDRQPYDIEHIWAREKFNNDKKLSDEDRRELNGIGNLVVLNRSINRQIKDNPTKEKKKKYEVTPKNEYRYRAVEKLCEGDKLEKWQDDMLKVKERQQAEINKIRDFYEKQYYIIQ